MALTATSDLEDSINVSVFEQSSPESLRPRAFSPPRPDRSISTSSDLRLHDEIEDDYFGPNVIQQCSSSRSSISAFPSSVIHTVPFTDNEEGNVRTPSRSQLSSNGRSSPANKGSYNNYLSAFRHPNSVRALQLESEYADSDNSSVVRSSRHRKSPRVSHFSPRSPGSIQSSPTKRSSRPATPQTQRSSSKLKKEFPLVLLHCTLLPPATTTRGPTVPEEILEAVLPEEFRKRWRTLQDKVVKNSEVKQRGVLIAHPRDDYDLLEERLLEALELERPRIRKGHYIGTSKSDSDSGFESSSQQDTDEGSDAGRDEESKSKDKCPDCGKGVSRGIEQDRKWEVKIFAANGLMRSGAWSAAWEQMEKIDVEVAVWMPEDVRFEVEERLKAVKAKEEAEEPIEEATESPKKKRTRSNTARLRHDERMREIYGQPEKSSTQIDIDNPTETSPPKSSSIPVESSNVQDDTSTKTEHFPSDPIFDPMQFHQQESPPQPDFLTFMKHHIRTIVNDQRNLAIVLLSVFVLFFSAQNLNVSNTPSSKPGEVTQPETASITNLDEIPQVSVDTSSLFYSMSTIVAASPDVSPIPPQMEKLQESGNLIRDEEINYISEPPQNEHSANKIPFELRSHASQTGSDPGLEITSSQLHRSLGDRTLSSDLEQMTLMTDQRSEANSLGQVGEPDTFFSRSNEAENSEESGRERYIDSGITYPEAEYGTQVPGMDQTASQSEHDVDFTFMKALSTEPQVASAEGSAEPQHPVEESATSQSPNEATQPFLTNNTCHFKPETEIIE